MLGNVTVLERPVHSLSIVSAARAALRARRRQRQSEAHLKERERAEAALRELAATLEDRVMERTGQLSRINERLTAEIAERRRTESMLTRVQKLEAIGQLTSGIAHDFNNLLTVVLGNLGFLERNFESEHGPKQAQQLANIRGAAQRGAKLTAQMLAFSRRQHLVPKATDLNETVANLMELMQSTMGGSIRIETVLADGLWFALVDPTQMELVILNLAINARDAMQVGGALVVKTANAVLGLPALPEEPSPGEYVVVSVSDTGTGMTEEVRASAFEPFFTTKDVGRGSGLGLSQVLGFAKQSGGGVHIETRVGQGTTVQVFLPRAVDAVAAKTRQQQSQGSINPGDRTPMVLLVDDDATVREVAATMLRERGYLVVEAGSGATALDQLDGATQIDLAVIDFAMPGMNGAELARRIKIRNPLLPIVFVTGYVDLSALPEVDEDRMIRKPFVEGELSAKVCAALAASAPSRTLRGPRSS